jgi:hypothetical protein
MLASPDLARECGENARRITRANFILDYATERFERLCIDLLARKVLRQAAVAAPLRLK